VDERGVCELLGKSVKQLRKRKNWSQETLAEKAEVSANFLSNIENGKVWVSPKTVAKMAEAFNVEPHELFMPEISTTDETRAMLFRYDKDARKALSLALDDLKERYTEPPAAPASRPRARTKE